MPKGMTVSTPEVRAPPMPSSWMGTWKFVCTHSSRPPSSSPSGTYRETGTELFVGSTSEGAGTFETTYRFEAKYEDPTDPATEIFGRCQHPIVKGSGTGIFEGVTGRP